ncbi:hypothetical protein [Streptomyces sp. NPDC048623]|uniref:hypothetical protein n=1 Tax=Streptomyces sp. NPDC048623 TaxID=3155761 RepID=UPI003433BF68
MLDENEDIRPDVDALRDALAAHGITLPSLGVDLLSIVGTYIHPPLVALGNCHVATARRLTAVLRKAATGVGG